MHIREHVEAQSKDVVAASDGEEDEGESDEIQGIVAMLYANYDDDEDDET
jgi:hypothetical protein